MINDDNDLIVVNDIPNHVILCHASLVSWNLIARFITQAFLALFDNGGGNLHHDYSSARAHEVLSAQL